MNKLFLTAIAAIISISSLLNASEEQSKYVVYYFYKTFRCYSCNAIEEMTKKSVTGGEVKLKNGSQYKVSPKTFAASRKAGILSFEAINVDLKKNEHYLTDFKTRAKYPVIAEIKGDKIIRYKVLPQVWPLLRKGDAEEMVSFIQKNIQNFMTTAQK